MQLVVQFKCGGHPMTSYRIIDLRSSIVEAEVKIVDAASPEQAVVKALDVDAVRSGAKKDLVARVYWQVAPNQPTNMVRMYARLDPERASAGLERDKHRAR